MTRPKYDEDMQKNAVLCNGVLLREAWVNAGPHPEYHAAVKERLRQDWPTLYEIIDRLSSFSAMIEAEDED